MRTTFVPFTVPVTRSGPDRSVGTDVGGLRDGALIVCTSGDMPIDAHTMAGHFAEAEYDPGWVGH